MEGDSHQHSVPVGRPHFWGEERAYVLEAIDTGWVSSQGRFVDQFESEFATFIGSKHAVAVCNGTCALQLALAALGIGRDQEVIVPDFSMMAPIFAVLHAGARPVPVDADQTWNIDPDRIESKISSRTKAMIVVHTYGHPANMKPLLQIASKYGLHLIEDAAECHGATVGGQKAGSIGTIGTFSFYANKIITTGEGGMLVTNDDFVALRLRSMRDMNFGDTSETRFMHKGLGYNFRMSNLHGAIGAAQVKYLDRAIADRRRIASEYQHELTRVKGITLPPAASWANPVNWVYGILVEQSFGVSRQILQQRLKDAGIETRRFFTPFHEQTFCSGVDALDFPTATKLAQQGLYLPTFVGLDTNTIRRIAATIRQANR